MIFTAAEYLDRLSFNKIERLREIIGTGELYWKDAWNRVPKKKKEEVAKVVFGANIIVKRVWIVHEKDLSTGHTIPVICAEYERTTGEDTDPSK